MTGSVFKTHFLFMMLFKIERLTNDYFCNRINKQLYNLQFSYLERWRDWPCEALATAFLKKCANSRGVNAWR